MLKLGIAVVILSQIVITVFTNKFVMCLGKPKEVVIRQPRGSYVAVCNAV